MQKFFFLVFLCSMVSLTLAQSSSDSIKSEINLRTYVESENVPLNREVVYHLELSWQGDLSHYNISEIIEPAVTNLSTRGSGSSNKVRTNPMGDMVSVKDITFYFRPSEIGMAYIDGVIIRYHDTVAGKDESLISSRIGIKITEPLPDSSDSGTLTGVAGGGLVVVLFALGLILFLRYKKRQREELTKSLSEMSETVEEKYLRLLKETIHLNTDNIKDGLSDLSHLLTGYFSEHFNIPALNMSNDDLLKALSEKDFSENSMQKVKDFYTKANKVKFAGEFADESDFHQLYDTVEQVLETQKSRNNTEEDK